MAAGESRRALLQPKPAAGVTAAVDTVGHGVFCHLLYCAILRLLYKIPFCALLLVHFIMPTSPFHVHGVWTTVPVFDCISL